MKPHHERGGSDFPHHGGDSPPFLVALRHNDLRLRLQLIMITHSINQWRERETERR